MHLPLKIQKLVLTLGAIFFAVFILSFALPTYAAESSVSRLQEAIQSKIAKDRSQQGGYSACDPSFNVQWVNCYKSEARKFYAGEAERILAEGSSLTPAQRSELVGRLTSEYQTAIGSTGWCASSTKDTSAVATCLAGTFDNIYSPILQSDVCKKDISACDSSIIKKQSEARSAASSNTGTPPKTTAGLCDNLIGNGVTSSLVNFSKLGSCMAGVVYVFAVGITTPIAYVGATIFELTLPISLSGSIFAQPAIAQAWTVVRDVANIAFLFILIYIAFSVMLENFGPEMKKALVNVIIVALIVNFSFFISRIIIDAGNLIGLQFYNAINVAGKGNLTSATATIKIGDITLVPAKPLTEAFMSGVNLQNIIGSDEFKKFTEGDARGDFITVLTTLSFIFLTMGAMLAVLAYVFLYAAVKLIVRIVVLWFTIILSPLAFVAWILPATSGMAHKWWETHIKNALFPAAFLFALYVIYLIIGTTNNTIGVANWDQVFNALNSVSGSNLSWLQKIAITLVGVGIKCVFLVVMLLGALKIADMFGHEGAGMAKGFAKWVGGKYTGTLGFAGRRTLGAAGFAAGESRWLNKWAKYDPILGRNLRRGASLLGTASFDARKIPGVGEGASGTPQKGGYAKTFKEKKEARVKEGERLGEIDKKDAGAREQAAKEAAENAFSGQMTVATTALTEASSRQEAAARVEEQAARELKEAAEHVEDLQKQGRIGTPEMAAAIVERKRKQLAHEQRKFELDQRTKDKKDREAERDDVQKQIDTLAAATLKKSSLKESYASEISTRSWRNAYQVMNAFMVPGYNKAAAEKIRKGKSREEKLKELLKEDADHDKGGGGEKKGKADAGGH